MFLSYLRAQAKAGHRRGITCSNPCRQKQFKLWMLIGMKKDVEYQALLRERKKLRAFVRVQKMKIDK